MHKIIEEAEDESAALFLSAISLVEVGMLVDKRRVSFDMSVEEWYDEAQIRVPVEVIPVTDVICRETMKLSDFQHFDPSDRIIVATALVEELPLITADRVIRKFPRIETIF